MSECIGYAVEFLTKKGESYKRRSFYRLTSDYCAARTYRRAARARRIVAGYQTMGVLATVRKVFVK